MSGPAQRVFVDLVIDNGELVRIECPSRYEDELHDSIENRMKRGDWWSVRQFADCMATYMGHNIERVAMRRVVALL